MRLLSKSFQYISIAAFMFCLLCTACTADSLSVRRDDTNYIGVTAGGQPSDQLSLDGNEGWRIMFTPPLPPSGKNAYFALYFLPYDIPSRNERVVWQKDVAALTQCTINNNCTMFTSYAEQHYPKRYHHDDNDPEWCGFAEDHCLDKVAAKKEAYAALVRKNADFWIALDALLQYDYYRSLMPKSLGSSYFSSISFHYLFKNLTRHSLRFAEGKPQEALHGVCHDISLGKLLLNDADNLMVTMIGNALIQRNAALLSEMLARMPEDMPLPNNCVAALQPLPIQQLSLCVAMRGEFVFQLQLINEMMLSKRQASEDNLFEQQLLADVALLHRASAQRLFPFCDEAVIEQVKKDQKIDTTVHPAVLALNKLSCNSPTECAVGMPSAVQESYDKYQHRMQDSALILKTLQAILWLRQHHASSQPDTKLVTLFARLPAQWNSSTRPLHMDMDKRQILLFRYNDKTLNRFPLAGSAQNKQQ